jgi:tetratricopeptide (TPR) repeat protein
MSDDLKVAQAIEVLCDRLAEQTATLFLGAGINAGLIDRASQKFPLGNDLSAWFCRDLLESPDLQISLDEAAEMARHRAGSEGVNKYIYDRFQQFSPGVQHLSLVSLPWDVVYTTNYDLLVERAAESLPGVARPIRSIFSATTDLSSISEAETVYYKLHGSIDYANTEEGRLILTKEDYRYYETHRRPLFRRLHRDLLGRTLLFAGYSLSDSNFRGILEDCRQELGIQTLPLSFALRPRYKPIEEAFWREKYNIQLLDIGAEQFFYSLLDTWKAGYREVVPLEVRLHREYTEIDSATRFSRIGGAFYQINPGEITGKSDAAAFFNGGEPSWSDIRDGVAPERDAYWTLFEGLFPELVEPAQPPSVYLITGPAGTGKTTLLHSVAYVIASEFQIPVLAYIPGTPLDAASLGPLVDPKNPRRIVVLIRHAASVAREIELFVESATRKNIPVTILLEERKNQWLVAAGPSARRLAPAEYELGTLSSAEIRAILKALHRQGLLGKLTGLDYDQQVEHFEQVAHQELIIALRELTSHGSFDGIILDEYRRIPSDIGRRAYVYVSALGQLDLPLRYENLSRLLQIPFTELTEHVFRPTARVLISGEQTGNSRHNAGFNLMTRHPTIASLIFSAAAPDDATKFQIINDVLAHLDPGYREDERLLGAIVRRRELVNTLASPDYRRAIYERLATILPDDPFVYQHRALLEKDLGDADLALRYARRAVELEKNNPALQNTLGLTLEFAAREVRDPMRRRGMLAEATRLFEDGMRRDPSNPFAYIGLQAVYRQEAENERDVEKRAALDVKILSLLENAFEETEEHPIIAGELARQKERLGDPERAIQLLQSALVSKPNDSRLRDLLIGFELQRNNRTAAIGVAREGVKFDPTSWKLQRHIARILKSEGGSVDAIRGHYDAAIRHRKGDVALLVEAAAFLYMQGLREDARGYFDQVRQLRINGVQKRTIRERWRTGTGAEKIFNGRVASIRGASAWVMAVPENFEAMFWRETPELLDLKVGDIVDFTVGFNGHGPLARVRPR